MSKVAFGSNNIVPLPFSFNTIKDFDNHICQSIPSYEAIIAHIKNISTYFAVKDTCIYDLGCSTGKLLTELSVLHGHKNIQFIGYDTSTNLIPKSNKNVTFELQDITDENCLLENAYLVLSVFTLQFLPIEKRQLVISKVFDSLQVGGAFIWCEKTLCQSGLMQDVFAFSHYDYKSQFFTPKEILKKQLDLRNIMKPLGVAENEQLLRVAGFKTFDIFFQSLNFRCWLCIKDYGIRRRNTT